MSDGGAWIPRLGGFISVQPDIIHADDEKQPTQISDPRCKSPFESIYLKPNHLTCIEILDRTCHFFLCSACVYCAVVVWWGAAESGEHLHGWAEPVWGTVAVHSEPWQRDQELIARSHVRLHRLVIITVGEGLKKRLSKKSMVALLCVVAGPCLRHPAYPTQSSPKGKRWYLIPVRVVYPAFYVQLFQRHCWLMSLCRHFGSLKHPSTFSMSPSPISHLPLKTWIIDSHFFQIPNFSHFSLLPATGSVSKFEASLCPGPYTAGTGAWRQPVTIGPLPEDALFTWWTPASGHSATRPVQPWLIGGPSRNSACCRCW